MTTFGLLLVTALGTTPASWTLASTRQPPPTDAPASDEPDLDEAVRLFNEGQARYDAADYEGAIETFTLALGEVRDQGVDDFRVLGPLLFNIGRARARAYEIDRDIVHLRQAAAVFERFIAGAESSGDAVEASDVAEAREQLAAIQTKLDELESSQPTPEPTTEPTPESEPTTAQPQPQPQPQSDGAQPRADKARRIGAGLTAGGVALLGGGVGMLVWGIGYGPAATSQVAELDALDLAADHPAVLRGDEFIADERRKGATWMVAGGVAATLGVTSLAIGVAQLVEAKRLRSAHQLGAAAMLAREGVLVAFSGRF